MANTPVRQYIGARYVPLFADPAEWNNQQTYEPLTIVIHQGNSYTSRQYVPVGIDINNTDFWALTGNYNAQVESYRQETKQALSLAQTNESNITDIDNNLNALHANTIDDATTLYKAITKQYYNPIMFGAALDGTTDDTAAIQAAINMGNVRLPANSKIKLGKITVPKERIIDFNYSTITQSDTQCITYQPNNNNYGGYGILKNAIFDNTANNPITLTETIDLIIQNIRAPKTNNTTVINITNCFNIYIDNVFIGNDVPTRGTGTGIQITANTNTTIVGTNDLTNIKITNSLIQRQTTGINITINENCDSDTIKIENCGFSNVETGIILNGSQKVTIIENTRCEHSNVFINATGNNRNLFLDIKNIHTYNCIDNLNINSARLTISGHITFTQSTNGQTAYKFTNAYANFNCEYQGTQSTTVDASTEIKFVEPHAIINHTGRDFTDIIKNKNPFYNLKIYKVDYWELTDLPTDNIPIGTKIEIYSDNTNNPLMYKQDTTKVYARNTYNGYITLVYVPQTKKWNFIAPVTIQQ